VEPKTQLLRYQIMEPLGAGGQGRTFLAIDRESGRKVAVKVLALSKIGDWKPFDLFEREVTVLRELDHPAIPKYIDHYASEESGDYFLVMELASGTSLRDRIERQKPLSPAEVEHVFERMLDVLEYLHGRAPPVIHRDIRPANILLDADGGVFLVDFGGVRVALRAGGGSTMIGTFGYMAPEQLHGDATPKTDVYALAATMAALLVGVEADKLPRDGLRIDLAGIMPPSRLRDTLARMLEPEPGRRLGSVAEVRRSLDDTSGDAGSAAASIDGDDGDDEFDASGDDTDAGTGHAAGRWASSGAGNAVAPFDVTREVRELARVPPPFSFLVWLWSVAMTGVLVLLEMVILPIVYQLMHQPGRHGRGPRGRRRRGRDHREYRKLVARHRRALEYVAGRTSPGRRGRRRRLRAAEDDAKDR
jgi:serine/threonine protein kinase